MATPGLYIDTNTLQVGIGTTRPQQAFHVQGNILSSGTITASNLSILGDFVTLNTVTSNTEQVVVTNAGTGPALKVTQTGANSIAEFYDDGNVLAMTIADGGNVGIGTANPQAKLHVASDSFNVMSLQRINNAAGGAQIELKNGTGYNVSTFIGGDSNMYFQSGAPGDNSKSFILAPSGNVGIGTIMPLAKLHVQGDVTLTNRVIQKPSYMIRKGFALSTTAVYGTQYTIPVSDNLTGFISYTSDATAGDYFTVQRAGLYSLTAGITLTITTATNGDQAWGGFVKNTATTASPYGSTGLLAGGFLSTYWHENYITGIFPLFVNDVIRVFIVHSPTRVVGNFATEHKYHICLINEF